MTSSLRQRRAEAGLSQGALAKRVGLSRQAVVAIEAGRQVPSTVVALQLARVLRCDVEDLFALSSGPTLSATLAAGDARRVTRLTVGRVDGAWAAHPVERGDRPGDGLLVGEADSGDRVLVEPLGDVTALERNVLVAGCAPLLGVLAGCLGRRHEEASAAWIPAHSARALELLERGLVHVAGLHLVDAQVPEGHAAIVREHFPAQAMTIVNLTRWRQGLVVQEGNPLGIRAPDDLLRPDVRLVRRDPGAGAHKLVQRLLAERADRPGAGGPIASGHAEVARLVRLGLADVGVAIEAVALAEGLDFIPLVEERFDLIIPRGRLDAQPVTRLLELVDRPAFQAEARRIPGYDLSTAGHASTVAV